ncbi:hypothetical protein ACRALDRAFT_2041905 [Sodiomyces alcalophilus JCM 7366]|uniref:uncharacterized protein n=1 Tax=Sodiomyces alcalophilus JCM 7366 TaxID=591952 RepID=UPI0039B50155
MTRSNSQSYDAEATVPIIQVRDEAIRERIARAHGPHQPGSLQPGSGLDPGFQRIPLDDSVNAALTGAATQFSDLDDYERQRRQLLLREKAMGFDFHKEATASDLERRANHVFALFKLRDRVEVYDAAEPREGWHGQTHPRFPGDHFLANVDLIEKTKVFQVAQLAPKGAHLHIHFNSCLPPAVLLDVAKSMERMFIWSDTPLVESDVHAFDRCEIQFSIRSVERERQTPGGNLFDPDYQPGQEMRFDAFLESFPREQRGDPETWLAEKLMFTEEEAHHHCQTAKGAWAKLNGRTRMMKGLFNYDTAYRTYTRRLLEDFVRDNIQYAEIRPNFMSTNKLWSDDGTERISNRGIMAIIIEETKAFMADHAHEFGGLKVIYCTPRSFDSAKVKFALDECLEFKQLWPEWIAGFDLVGEEDMGRPLKDFVPELLAFQQKCREANVDIPFLFHCGETLAVGDEADGNLLDALLLNARRIGHGFALTRHPYIMEQMKKQNVCLELCPISNEVLGLTSRVSGHAMYDLLANNVHCTVSSDNGAMFRSTLSHDFYQVTVGKSDMSLHGWRQLIEWSLEHSCMDDREREMVYEMWKRRWDRFLHEVIELGMKEGVL